MIFETYATQATNPLRIAKQLNKLGTKPNVGEAWKHNHIREILEHPIYVGRARTLARYNGKYFDMQDGVPVLSSRHRKRKKSEWVLSDELFKPLIGQPLFDQVQAKLERNPERRRGPRSSDLFLAGLLYCGNCGKKMKGWGVRNEYLCSSYGKKVASYDVADAPPACERNFAPHQLIMEYVERYLRETGKELETFLQVYKTGNLELLKPFHEKHCENIDRLTNLIERMGEVADPDGVPNTLGVFDPIHGWTVEIMERAAHDPSDESAAALDGHFSKIELLQSKYREVFTKDEAAVRAELAALEVEREKLADRIMNLPKTAKRTIDREGDKLLRIENQMVQKEERLKNLADEMDTSRDAVKSQIKSMKAARQALGDDNTDNLRKAEAIRSVIRQARLYFEPTGKKWPKTRLIAVEIVPVVGDPYKYSLCGTATPS